MGELVAAGRDVERADDIGVCVRTGADGFHLALENEADDQREDHRAEGDEKNGTGRAAADGLTGGCLCKEVLTAGNKVVEAACPVVVAEIVEVPVIELENAVLVEGIVCFGTVDKVRELAVIHAQKQNDTVTVLTLAEGIFVVELPGGFIG